MDTTFGEKLKSVRKQKGMVQKELGDYTGVGQAAIANYEKGIRFPGEETLKKLTEVLGVSLDYLLSVNPQINSRNRSHVPSGDYSERTFLSLLTSSSLEDAHQYLQAEISGRTISMERLCTTIFVPLLHTIGNQWASGEISVAEEHIISGKIRELIILMGSELTRNMQIGPGTGKTWLGFSAPGDEHDIGMLMLSWLMKEQGWNTVFLGMAPPIRDLLEALDKYSPNMIAVSLTIGVYWNGMQPYLEAIAGKTLSSCRTIIGGQGVMDHRTSLESMGFHVVESLQDAARLVD